MPVISMRSALRDRASDTHKRCALVNGNGGKHPFAPDFEDKVEAILIRLVLVIRRQVFRVYPAKTYVLVSVIVDV